MKAMSMSSPRFTACSVIYLILLILRMGLLLLDRVVYESGGANDSEPECDDPPPQKKKVNLTKANDYILYIRILLGLLDRNSRNR